MLGNDISNDAPRRAVIHVSSVFVQRTTIRKVAWVVPVLGVEYEPSYLSIAFFRQWRDSGLRTELFHYTDDGYPADDMYQSLDEYDHPFTKLMEFQNVKNLSDYLAFSPDIEVIVDPLHPNAFGSRGRGL